MTEFTVSDISNQSLSIERRVNKLASNEQDFGLPANRQRLEAFGFKLTEGGAHISRTIMLKEITRLLASSDTVRPIEDYSRLVLEENLLGKSTETTRLKTFRHLRELYALSTGMPIFSVYRELMRIDSQSAPLLSFLIAWARDPLLRATTPTILNATVGGRVMGDDFQQALGDAYPHQYSAKNIGKIARNAASSWTQSGHLTGRTKKIRSRVQPRPAALTFALILGQVAGAAGAQLFSSICCRLLDLNPSEARSLAEQAHRQELITTAFDFFSAMYFFKARRLFCLLRLCEFFRASCFMLILLVRRDKAASCVRMGVPHGEGLATHVGLESCVVRGMIWG